MRVGYPRCVNARAHEVSLSYREITMMVFEGSIVCVILSMDFDALFKNLDKKCDLMIGC